MKLSNKNTVFVQKLHYYIYIYFFSFISTSYDTHLRTRRRKSSVLGKCRSVPLPFLFVIYRWRVIGISRSLIWSKTLMELMFKPCGEFQWSPEGPVSQIHSPHLHGEASGIFPDLLWSIQMLKIVWSSKNNGKLPHLFIPSKLQPWFLRLQWKICLWAELQFWFLSLQWNTCPWAEHSDDDDDDDDDDDYYCNKFEIKNFQAKMYRPISFYFLLFITPTE